MEFWSSDPIHGVILYKHTKVSQLFQSWAELWLFFQNPRWQPSAIWEL